MRKVKMSDPCCCCGVCKCGWPEVFANEISVNYKLPIFSWRWFLKKSTLI